MAEQYPEKESSLGITEEELFNLLLKTHLNSTNNQSLIEEFRQNFTKISLTLHQLSKSPELVRKLYLKNISIVLFYSLIIMVSLFGNLLVFKVIVSQRLLRRRVTNVLILNLTASDLLMTVLAIPVTVTRLILDDWPFGSLLCIFEPLIQVTSIYVSALTMAVIALDRYQVLVNPMKTRICNKIPKFIILALIWITGGLLSIPHSMFNRIVELYGFGPIFRCRTVYPEPKIFYQKFFPLLTTITQYLIPLSVTLLTYGLIALKIHKKASIGEMTEQQIRSRLNTKQKTIKMLMTVVIVFAVCWLPINALNIMNYLFNLQRPPVGHNTFLFCHWLAFSSVCWNPFIYFGLNPYYRQELNKFFSFKNSVNNTDSNSQVMNTRSTVLLSRTIRMSELKSNIRSNFKENQRNCMNSTNSSFFDKTKKFNN